LDRGKRRRSAPHWLRGQDIESAIAELKEINVKLQSDTGLAGAKIILLDASTSRNKLTGLVELAAGH